MKDNSAIGYLGLTSIGRCTYSPGFHEERENESISFRTSTGVHRTTNSIARLSTGPNSKTWVPRGGDSRQSDLIMTKRCRALRFWSNAADRNHCNRLARWRWIAPRGLRWPDCDSMTCRLSDRNTVMCEIFASRRITRASPWMCLTGGNPLLTADDNQAPCHAIAPVHSRRDSLLGAQERAPLRNRGAKAKRGDRAGCSGSLIAMFAGLDLASDK